MNTRQERRSEYLRDRERQGKANRAGGRPEDDSLCYSWRTTRIRAAPSDSRTAISRPRPVALLNSMFATLAQHTRRMSSVTAAASALTGTMDAMSPGATPPRTRTRVAPKPPSGLSPAATTLARVVMRICARSSALPAPGPRSRRAAMRRMRIEKSGTTAGCIDSGTETSMANSRRQVRESVGCAADNAGGDTVHAHRTSKNAGVALISLLPQMVTENRGRARSELVV